MRFSTDETDSHQVLITLARTKQTLRSPDTINTGFQTKGPSNQTLVLTNKMPIGQQESGVTSGVKFVTSTVGNTVGGVTNTLGGVVGALGRGVGETVNEIALTAYEICTDFECLDAVGGRYGQCWSAGC